MMNKLNTVLFFLISLFVIVSCHDAVTADNNEYIENLLLEVSTDYPLSKDLDGAVEWVNDVNIELKKTVIFYDDESTAEKSSIQDTLRNMGANLDRDVITVNLSAVPENKTSELNREAILKSMHTVYDINSLPAVFIHGTYLGNDLNEQLESAKAYLATRPTLLIVTDESDYLDLVSYATERSVKTFIDNRITSKSDKPVIAYFNVNANEGMNTIIKSLIPDANELDIKFYNLNDDIYDDVLTDSTPINLKKEQVYNYLVHTGAGMPELGIFVFLSGEPMILGSSSKKGIVNLAESVVQKMIKPKEVDENGVTPIEEPETNFSEMSILENLIKDENFMTTIKAIVEEQLPRSNEENEDIVEQ